MFCYVGHQCLHYFASSWQPIDRDSRQFILCNIDNANDMSNSIVCKHGVKLICGK